MIRHVATCGRSSRSSYFFIRTRSSLQHSLLKFFYGGKKRKIKIKEKKDRENNFARRACVVHSLEMEAIG